MFSLVIITNLSHGLKQRSLCDWGSHLLHCCEADVFSKELGQVTLGLWIWMSAQQFSHEIGLGVARQCPSFDLILSECIMEEDSCKETLRLSKTHLLYVGGQRFVK